MLRDASATILLERQLQVLLAEAAGVLEGKRATCYPGFELPSATQVEEPVVIDGNVITSRGVGSALSFALALVSRLAGPAKAADLAERMLVSA